MVPAYAVALALATQLKALRWEVRIGGGQASPAGKARKGARLLRFRFGGEVAFWVKQSKGVTRATVEGKVTVHGPDGGQIHRGAARGTSESRGKVTVRAKRAMGQALHRFVRSVLGDARLGRALVKAIRNAKNAP